MQELECPLCDAGTCHWGLDQRGSGELPSGVPGHWATVAGLVAAEHSGGSVVTHGECREGGIQQRHAGWPPCLGPEPGWKTVCPSVPRHPYCPWAGSSVGFPSRVTNLVAGVGVPTAVWLPGGRRRGHSSCRCVPSSGGRWEDDLQGPQLCAQSHLVPTVCTWCLQLCHSEGFCAADLWGECLRGKAERDGEQDTKPSERATLVRAHDSRL